MKLPWRFRLVHFLHRSLAVIFNLWSALILISFLSGRSYPQPMNLTQVDMLKNLCVYAIGRAKLFSAIFAAVFRHFKADIIELLK